MDNKRLWNKEYGMGFISDSIKRFQEMTERGEPGTQEAKALFNMFGQTLNDIVQGTIAGTVQSHQRAAEEQAGRERFQMMAAMLGLQTHSNGNLTTESKEKILSFIADTIELRRKANFMLGDRISARSYGQWGNANHRWYEFTVSGNLLAGDPNAGHDAADAFRRFLDSVKITYKERVTRNIAELVTWEKGSTHVFRVSLHDVPSDWHRASQIDLEDALSQLLNAMAPPGARVPKPEPDQPYVPRYDDDEVITVTALVTEPDYPMAIGYKTQWYAMKAASSLEALLGLDLDIVGAANWQTGLEAAQNRNGFIFVSPPVNGYVYAIGNGCSSDMDSVAALGQRFDEFMYFGTHRVVELHSWAKCQNGQLERYYTFCGEQGQASSFGGATPEEVALGLDQCAQSTAEFHDRRSPKEEDVLTLAKAWGVDPSFTGVHIGPACGYLCRPANPATRDQLLGGPSSQGHPTWENEAEVRASLSTDPDQPIGFGDTARYYAVKAASSQEVVDKMELPVVGAANWRTGLAAAWYDSDYVFVSPPVNGRVYVIGGRCATDYRAIAALGARFPELMFFGTISKWSSWAKCQDGQLLRYYTYDDFGYIVSLGTPTKEEVALGLDQCVTSVYESMGEDRGEDPRIPVEGDPVGLAQAWGIDTSFTDAPTEPGCGYLCRGMKAYHEFNQFMSGREWLDDDHWSEADDDGNGEIYDYGLIEAYGADSVEPDLPMGFEPKTPWYAARASFPLEVVAKMELGIVGVANWRTGFQGCLYNDFIFVTPWVRGYVYAIGRGCSFDHQIFATMGGRFKELMYFSRNSWARSQDGQLTRYYTYANAAGVPESVGEPTAEEIELGFDQFVRWVDPSGGGRPRLPAEKYVLPLAKAWGADPGHTDADVEPGHGYLCRPVGWGPATPDDHPSSLPRQGLKSRRNDVDGLTLCSPMSDPDSVEIERLRSFFLPHRPDPDGYDEVRWPLAPPPGWAESHAPYDDSYIESYAELNWIDDQLLISSPRGKQIFDTIYQACVATGWYAVASCDDVRLVFTDESFNSLRLPRHDEAIIWIDSAEDLRAFHGERETWKCGFIPADIDVYFDESGQLLMVPSFDGDYGQPERLSWDGEAGPAELGEKVLKCLTASCNRIRPEPDEAYVGTKLGMHSFIKTRQRVHVGTDPTLGPLSVAFWRRTESLEYVPPGKDDPVEWTVRLPLDAGPDAVGKAVLQVLRAANIPGV